MKWYAIPLPEGNWAVTCDKKRRHALYDIAVCSNEYDAHRVARLLNADEEENQ